MEEETKKKIQNIQKILYGSIKELINKLEYLFLELDYIQDLSLITRKDNSLRIKTILNIYKVF